MQEKDNQQAVLQEKKESSEKNNVAQKNLKL